MGTGIARIPQGLEESADEDIILFNCSATGRADEQVRAECELANPVDHLLATIVRQ